jgi:hypothetical protein
LHFFYGLGAFVTPLVVQLFLKSPLDASFTSNCYSPEDVEQYFKFQRTQTLTNQTHASSIPSDLFKNKYQSTNKTKYAFWILAFIQLPVPFCLLLLKLGRCFRDVSTEIIDDQIFSTYANLNDENYDELFSSSEMPQPASSKLTDKLAKSFAYFTSALKNNAIKTICLIAVMVFVFDGLQVC